jgi:reactive intermediate/imine deaminase
MTNTTDTVDAISLHDSPDLVAPLGHYSHVAVQRGVAYISGQLPVDATGTPLADKPFAAQVQQVLRNLDGCLTAVGSDRRKLLQVTVHVTDIAEWPAFDALYKSWIGDHEPARAVCGVSELHYGSAVEVHAIAVAD